MPRYPQNLKHKRAIQRFLRTGDYDPAHRVWPGDALQRCRQGERELRLALIDELRRRFSGRSHPAFEDIDHRALVRSKVEPMVSGLFPPTERELVLAALEKSIVFLSANKIEQVILNSTWLHTAWVLANIYLESLGADLLGPKAPHALGLSEETSCYLSTAYFHETDPFADFLVHEAAHLFHNCHRRTIGLPETSRKRWPLTIAFGKQEEFAFACEFYSRMLALSSGLKQRQSVFGEFRTRFSLKLDEVDSCELLITLEQAVKAHNGWKRILARCTADQHQPKNTGATQPDRRQRLK